MHAEELAEILRLNAAWRRGEPGGKRADLSDADLSGVDFRDADLRDAILSRADLSGVDFRDADLRGAILSGADLFGVDFRDADLRDADLSDADLSGVDFRGVDFRGAILSRAILRGAVGLPVAEDAPQRLQAVAAHVLAQPEVLQMAAWHSDCGTAHCLAGWAIHQAGPLGAVLEKVHGPHLAGMLLLGTEAAAHFYDDNEAAMDWLRSINTNTTEDTDHGNA